MVYAVRTFQADPDLQKIFRPLQPIMAESMARSEPLKFLYKELSALRNLLFNQHIRLITQHVALN